MTATATKHAFFRAHNRFGVILNRTHCMHIAAQIEGGTADYLYDDDKGNFVYRVILLNGKSACIIWDPEGREIVTIMHRRVRDWE